MGFPRTRQAGWLLSALFLAGFLASHSAGIFAQTATPTTWKVEVSGKDDWKDSGLDVAPGDRLVISGTGTVKFKDSKPTGPQGLARGWRDLLRSFPVNQAGRGALIARIGDSAASSPFLVGPRTEMTASTGGRLFVGINQVPNDKAQGSFAVSIELTRAAAGFQPAGLVARGEARHVKSIAGVDAALLEKVPRRVADPDGTPGDMVNFLILGPEDAVQRALAAAGWVKVDRTTKDALLRGALATLSKQAYVELPMSELHLFDRPQDFGYAHAEPVAVVARRHHFRLWKAPLAVQGETLWVGAGTHDVGFDRDARKNTITHKIDPNVDEEREFIRESLSLTGQVAEVSYVLPRNPIRNAETAHGQAFHSDGRVLVLRLTASSRLDRSRAFAQLFCAVLSQQPDAAQWGACSQYLEAQAAEGSPAATFAPLSNDYRVLIVPGVMNTCLESTPAYQEAQTYLREKHELAVELLAVPNDSSEANGRLIADYLKHQSRGDARKYIVLGYSKGAPDVQVALAQDREAAARVAAFVSVAGAVGGSPIAEAMPAVADRWVSAFQFGTCRGDLATAFRSLRRDVRQAFLRRFPDPVVPTYSLAAVSDRSRTSKMLQQTWELVATYDRHQDGQLTKLDALVPGSVNLGAAIADHFAVALPLANADNPLLRSAADRNSYPRTALLEAMLRFVIQDLEKSK